MTRNGTILLVLTLLCLGGAVWASSTGFGLPQPEKNPPSIREESVRISGTGHHRTRYFIGGGIRRGK